MEDHYKELTSMTGRELLAGAVAGLAEHSVMFPFDTIKTRLQREPEHTFLVCMRDSIRNDGFPSLYRGLGPALTAAVPAHAAYFSAYEAMKRLLIVSPPSSSSSSAANSSSAASEPKSRVGSLAVAHAISACSAVSLHDAVTLPFDVVKQHMQVHKHHSSMWGCFQHVLGREGGIRRIYSALPITVTMNLPLAMTQWVVYEYLKAAMKLPNTDEEVFEMRYVVSGLVAGSCAAAVSNPFDVIKTHLQLDDKKVWSSTRATSTALFRQYGFSVFLSGVVPRVLQLGPSAAIVMTSYEISKKILGG